LGNKSQKNDRATPLFGGLHASPLNGRLLRASCQQKIIYVGAEAMAWTQTQGEVI